MSKIMNIGSLDVREINEELAKNITSMVNIGVLIESDESQLLLKNVNKVNIGATIRIPSDKKINIISHNGELEVDQEFMEGLFDETIILVNGSLNLSSDVDPSLFNKAIYSLLVNGEVICTKKLLPLVKQKGTVNGKLISYKGDSRFFKGNTTIDERFLKGLKRASKLAVETLILTDEISIDQLEEKIESIQVLEKVITIEKYDDLLAPLVDDYLSVKVIILPDSKNGVVFYESSIKIDDNTIDRYKDNVLFVDGNVEFMVKKDISISDKINHIYCNKITTNDLNHSKLRKIVGEEVQIEILRGRVFRNNGKMIFSDNLNEEISIINMGKMVFDKNLDYEKFKLRVLEITNYGVLEGPRDKMDIIRSKVVTNYGKLKEYENTDTTNNEEKKDEDIIYQNIAELKL